MSFCASRSVLQVRFFCIMSWSSPVITTTMNTPLKNCFQKFCRDTQSSKTNTRLWPLSITAPIAWPRLMSRASVTWTMMSIRAENMQRVWNVSVHTSVFTPPRRV